MFDFVSSMKFCVFPMWLIVCFLVATMRNATDSDSILGARSHSEPVATVMRINVKEFSALLLQQL